MNVLVVEDNDTFRYQIVGNLPDCNVTEYRTHKEINDDIEFDWN